MPGRERPTRLGSKNHPQITQIVPRSEFKLYFVQSSSGLARKVFSEKISHAKAQGAKKTF
jgi:hypothetical protein